MISIIKNNFYRSLEMKNYMITVIIITTFTIMFSIYFTNKIEMKTNIALVSNSKTLSINSKYLNITRLSDKPKKSELMLNKYDAVVVDNGNGEFEIDTIKDAAFKDYLQQILKGKIHAAFTGEKRGVGSNILGFLLMFILIEGILLMRLFAEDREDNIFKRIMYSPVSVLSYIFAYLIFTFILIYMPTMFILILESNILKVNIGFSIIEYSYMLALISFLAASFSIFMNALIKKYDNCSSLSCSIIVFTSILSGSFYTMKNHNKIIDKLVELLPEKQYMIFLQNIEKGVSINNSIFQLVYIVLVALIFLAVASRSVISYRKNI